jgi:hypothetical protein
MLIRNFIVLSSIVLISCIDLLNLNIDPINAQNTDKYLELDTVTLQNTSKSLPGVASGHETHGIVIPLSQRDDGKVWFGTITWISSEPVEIGYRLKDISNLASNYTNDRLHTLPLQNNNITYVIPNMDGKASSYYGSENFVADAVVVHSTLSSDFVITYTIDATAKELTN